jgi:hypothetical protein
MMENKELGRLVIKQAEAFPESFYMGTWARETPCGTTACIAGHALLLSGYSVQFRPMMLLSGEVFPDKRAVFLDPEGEVVICPQEARRLLGLSLQEENSLFYADEESAIARLRELCEED